MGQQLSCSILIGLTFSVRATHRPLNLQSVCLMFWGAPLDEVYSGAQAAMPCTYPTRAAPPRLALRARPKVLSVALLRFRRGRPFTVDRKSTEDTWQRCCRWQTAISILYRAPLEGFANGEVEVLCSPRLHSGRALLSSALPETFLPQPTDIRHLAELPSIP